MPVLELEEVVHRPYQYEPEIEQEPTPAKEEPLKKSVVKRVRNPWRKNNK